MLILVKSDTREVSTRQLLVRIMADVIKVARLSKAEVLEVPRHAWSRWSRDGLSVILDRADGKDV